MEDMKVKRGQILRTLRLSRQLTQAEAAKNFEISQQTYQKYESGKTEPPYDLLCDFATFYGVTADYLLGRESFQDPVNLLNLSPLEKSIVYAYIGLSPEKRTELVEIIRQIATGADVQLTISKPEIQKSETTQSPLVYCGTVGEELERRKREEEAIRKDTA